jgi:perosamine synthetase
VDDRDIASVVEALRSDWLTTGPRVEAFEEALRSRLGVRHAVAVSSGTAALHAAMHALGVGPGDEVLVPAITFAATANVVVLQGGTPVFVDVEEETLLVDAGKVEQAITERTKAVVAVDYAGHPCDYDVLRVVADRHGVALVADACHALGAQYRDRPAGRLADLTAFSFHPVKHITTGEGGMVTTDDAKYSERMRRFRNHGITLDHHDRSRKETWRYEIEEVGYNYRITDFQCALGISQLHKLDAWLDRRRNIARRYDQAFENIPAVRPLGVRDQVSHARHLYVVRVIPEEGQLDRAAVFALLRQAGIGVNVHYLPVHLHPFYRNRYGTGPGLCPLAEAAYEQILSLPIFPSMSDEEVDRVAEAVRGAVSA